MCYERSDPRSRFTRTFRADCLTLWGGDARHYGINGHYLLLAQRIQEYRAGIPLYASNLLREQLILLDLPQPKLMVNLANTWRDLASDGSAQRLNDVEALWHAIGYKSIKIVLRLGSIAQRNQAIALILQYSRRGRRSALSGSRVERILESAGLFVNTRRTQSTPKFVYKVGAEIRDALQRAGVLDDVLALVSHDVSDFILNRCNSVCGTP